MLFQASLNSRSRRKINENEENTTLRNINKDEVVSKTTLSNREDDDLKPKTTFNPVSRRRINDHFTKPTPTGNHNHL